MIARMTGSDLLRWLTAFRMALYLYHKARLLANKKRIYLAIGKTSTASPPPNSTHGGLLDADGGSSRARLVGQATDCSVALHTRPTRACAGLRGLLCVSSDFLRLESNAPAGRRLRSHKLFDSLDQFLNHGIVRV